MVVVALWIYLLALRDPGNTTPPDNIMILMIMCSSNNNTTNMSMHNADYGLDLRNLSINVVLSPQQLYTSAFIGKLNESLHT